MSASPVALITGAGRGIGRAAAVELSARGYRLVLAARTRAQLEATQRLIQSGPGSAIAEADLRGPEMSTRVVDAALAQFGRLDAIVHCAGLAMPLPVAQTPDAVWREVIDVNFSSAFYLARAAWPTLRQQGGGVIVNISSPAVHDPFPGLGVYGAAKAALNTLSLALAREGAAHHIRVHVISPGATETEMFRGLMTPEQFPPEKVLDPADVARVIALCVTGELRHTSGHVLELSKTL